MLYRVWVHESKVKVVEVEAEDEEEARDLASEAEPQDFKEKCGTWEIENVEEA